MITAHVNEMGIIMRFEAPDNLAKKEWESLLDELKAHHIPSLHPLGERSIVDHPEPDKWIVLVYFTTKTATIDEAIAILKKRRIEVLDVRGQF